MDQIPIPRHEVGEDIESTPQRDLMPNVPTIRIELTSSHPNLGKSKISAVIARVLREQIGENVEIIILNRARDYDQVTQALSAHGLEGRVDVERVFIVDFDGHYEEPKPDSPMQIFHPPR